MVMIREPLRQIRDHRREPRSSRQRLPAQEVSDLSLGFEPEIETRGFGRYAKSVERRVVAEKLVDVIEIVPRGLRGDRWEKESWYTRHREWRSGPARDHIVVREPMRYARIR
jgi:hypothetical protein